MLRATTLFVILNLLDLAGTLFLLGQSSGVFYELNPVARLFITWAGWKGLSTLKLLGGGVALASVIAIARTHPIVAIRLIDGLSLIVFVTCLWTGLIYLTGGMMVAALVCGVICLLGVIVAMGFEHHKLLDENRNLSHKLEEEKFHCANWRSLATGHSAQKILTTETYT